MKKTFITLLALSSAAVADQNLVINSSTTGNFDTPNGNGGNTVCNINVTESATITRIDGSALANLTTITLNVADNADFHITNYAKLPFNNTNKSYNTTLTLGTNSTMAVTNQLYLGTRNSSYTGITQSSVINFGAGASLSAGTLETVAPAGGTSSLTLNVTLSDEEIAKVGSVIFERELITTTSGISNNYTENAISLGNIQALNDIGYTNVGVVTDFAAITGSQYGLVRTNDKLTLFVAPEPATATLSLLALAGLAARRRR